MSAAPTHDSRSDDLTVTVAGPAAPDGALILDAHAREPRLWTVEANRDLDSPPEVAIGTRDTWHRTTWAAQGVCRLLLSGPSAEAEGAITVPVGAHQTWLRVAHGDTLLVRPAGRLRVG